MNKWALSLALLGCGKSESKETPPPPPTRPGPPTPVDAGPTVKLPAKSFDVAQVFGKGERDVEKILGKGTKAEDGPWSFDIGETVVDVVFERGKAVELEVHAEGESPFTDENRRAILAWMHAPPDIDEMTMESPTWVAVWAPGAQDRQRHRRVVAGDLTKVLKTGGVTGYASSFFTLLSVVPGSADHSCDRTTLKNLKSLFDGTDDDIAKAGFDTMQCDVDGVAIHVH